MFATIGRFDDQSTINRHLLTATLLASGAWTVLWIAAWAWLLHLAIRLLNAALVALWVWLFPSMVMEFPRLEPEPTVEVALEDPPLQPLGRALDGEADTPPLDAEDLAAASAEWEAKQRATAAAKRRAAEELVEPTEIQEADMPTVFAVMAAFPDDATASMGRLDKVEDTGRIGSGPDGVEGGEVGGVVGGVVLGSTDVPADSLAGGLGDSAGDVDLGSGGSGAYVAARPLPAPRIELLGGDDTLSREDALRAVQARGDALGRCYGAALVDHPSLQGTLTMSLHVGADGWILKAEPTGGSLHDGSLIRCAQLSLEGFALRAPSDGLEARIGVRATFAP